MNKKITCPVCGGKNEETSKICNNQKCKWDLTFTKDGVFVGLSEGDIKKYNKELLEAKKKFEEKFFQVKKKNNQQLTAEILKKHKFEKTADYEKRINNLGEYWIGWIKLKDYEADSEIITFKLSLNEKTLNYKDNIEGEYTMVIELNKAQKLFNYGKSKDFALLGTILYINNLVSFEKLNFHDFDITDIIASKIQLDMKDQGKIKDLEREKKLLEESFINAQLKINFWSKLWPMS